MDDGYTVWAARARQTCTDRGVEPPQPHELEDMYEDGLEPSNAADPRIRARYVHPPRRKPERTVTDIALEAARREGVRIES